MVNVFNSEDYAILYEQFNLDLGDIFGRFTAAAIDSKFVHKESEILEVGCGTGISTRTLFDTLEGINVVGIDQSNEFLNVAKVRFGLHYPGSFLLKLRRHKYNEEFKDYCSLSNLEERFLSEIKKYRSFRNRVEFINRDATNLHGFGNEFGLVFSNQVIHWFRTKNASQENPNLEYENEVLQSIRNTLRDKGKFVFNTNGSDFNFENQEINDIHFLNHPYYKIFDEYLSKRLGLNKKSHTKMFNMEEILRVLKQSGFKLLDSSNLSIQLTHQNLVELCYISGRMQFFQYGNLDFSEKDIDLLLLDTMKYANSQYINSSIPIIETGINFIAQKV